MCSSPHWQVGLSWFREKLSPANREQRLSRWADFAKNCLPRIGSKELPRFREKYHALERQKMGSNMRPRYIQFRDIRDRDISGLHCNWQFFILCDFEIWQMTLKNNRAPFLCYFKLCALFRGHRSFQIRVTVRKCSIRVKIDDFFVLCDLEIWWMTSKNNRTPLLCYFKGKGNLSSKVTTNAL